MIKSLWVMIVNYYIIKFSYGPGKPPIRRHAPPAWQLTMQMARDLEKSNGVDDCKMNLGISKHFFLLFQWSNLSHRHIESRSISFCFLCSQPIYYHFFHSTMYIDQYPFIDCRMFDHSVAHWCVINTGIHSKFNASYHHSAWALIQSHSNCSFNDDITISITSEFHPSSFLKQFCLVMITHFFELTSTFFPDHVASCTTFCFQSSKWMIPFCCSLFCLTLRAGSNHFFENLMDKIIGKMKTDSINAFEIDSN